MRGTRKFTKALAATTTALLAATALAACGDDSGGGSGGDNEVKIWMSVDPLVFQGLNDGIQALAADAGIKVKVEKVDNINQLIMTKLQAGDAPDIALIPQPGVVADIVKRGKATALDDVLDMSSLESSMTPGTLDAGTVDGKLYGLLVSMNVKSLVFYPKKAWDKAGYQAPASLGDLETLTDKIKSDGGTPWCFAIGSEAATGWPATDWIEDLVMRYGGADGYKSWVSHETPFDSDVVREAAGEMEKLLFADGNVPGGRGSMASTPFGNADDPMWKPTPGCWLLKQGNFIVSKDFLPADVISDVDANVGVFAFPPAEANGENPVLGGGDMAVLLNDSDNAKKAMEILANKDVGAKRVAESSFISPFTDYDMSLYPSELYKQIASIAYDSSELLFDGSDAMPGAVGAGTFWTDMTSWISGQEDLDQALKNIDQSWPAS